MTSGGLEVKRLCKNASALAGRLHTESSGYRDSPSQNRHPERRVGMSGSGEGSRGYEVTIMAGKRSRDVLRRFHGILRFARAFTHALLWMTFFIGESEKYSSILITPAPARRISHK